tara:strand:- start:23 stop:379 length:357 start_codon:yes stop_codon:yes gene_type:complete
MSDKESEESWINPEEDRGWSQESYRDYMKRRDAEEDVIRKGTYEYEYDNATSKQIGGDHYKNCAIQPIDYIVKNNLDFLEGNVVKYITRHKTKNGIEDIRKVIHYAELILEKKYGKEK